MRTKYQLGRLFASFLAVISVTCSLHAAAPAGYYSSCEDKCGAALLSALRVKIGAHTTVSYDGLWNVYDDSDVRDNGTVWDMYSTKEWTPGKEHCGNYKYVGDCLNREHSFPKSWFSNHAPMNSDAFHVYPTDGKVNGMRSNFPYGECADGTRESSHNGVQALGRLGASTFPGYTGKVFEPDDEYKGDFARTYFYMAAAYNDKISSWNSEMLAGNAYPAFTSWAVELLLKWHRQDPVSEKERKRNDAVYAHQGNRNPFIDNPEMAEYIWGDKKTTGWTPGGIVEPQINRPTAGTTLDLGLTAAGVTVSSPLQILTSNIDTEVTLSISGTGFTVTPSRLSAAEANNGTNVSVSYKGATSTGVKSGTLTVKAGALSRTVSLKAQVVEGLPAGPARNITDESFVAVWTYIGDAYDDEFYMLEVFAADGGEIPGSPFVVKAADGSYLIDDLNPATEYIYTVHSETLTSAPVHVTTADPIPRVDFLFEGDVHLSSSPSTASAAAELWIETENVSEAYTVTVEAPFQLSMDKSEWTSTVTVDPEADRLYIRIFALDEGDFETSLQVNVQGHYYDDAVVSATVRAPAADFLETFENPGQQSYSTWTYEGTACNWQLVNTGIFNSDPAHGGDQALRGGRERNAVIEMLQDKPGGIGYMRLYAHIWANDKETVSFDVMLSTNHGASWTNVGSISFSGTDYEEVKLPVNSTGDSRLKLVQTAGKRFLLDDFSLGNYATGISAPEAPRNTWDARSETPGSLTVELSAGAQPIEVCVYALDGRILASDVTVSTAAPLTFSGLVSGEVYIVTAPDEDGLPFSRRVLVK